MEKRYIGKDIRIKCSTESTKTLRF